MFVGPADAIADTTTYSAEAMVHRQDPRVVAVAIDGVYRTTLTDPTAAELSAYQCVGVSPDAVEIHLSCWQDGGPVASTTQAGPVAAVSDTASQLLTATVCWQVTARYSNGEMADFPGSCTTPQAVTSPPEVDSVANSLFASLEPTLDAIVPPPAIPDEEVMAIVETTTGGLDDEIRPIEGTLNSTGLNAPDDPSQMQQPIALNRDGCRGNTGNPHYSDWDGRDRVSVHGRTVCYRKVPELFVRTTLSRRRWWGFQKVVVEDGCKWCRVLDVNPRMDCRGGEDYYYAVTQHYMFGTDRELYSLETYNDNYVTC